MHMLIKGSPFLAICKIVLGSTVQYFVPSSNVVICTAERVLSF